MKRKRLDRDRDWGFQYFPYYQFRLETKSFCGLVSIIKHLDGDYLYWDTKKYWNAEKTDKVVVGGKGMIWLQLVPDGKNRLITAMYIDKPKKLGEKTYSHSLSVCYIDVIERVEFDPDGVAAYVDKYLDVVFTLTGDVAVLDRDELDEAFQMGEVTKSQYDGAVEEVGRITDELCSGMYNTEKRFAEILEASLNRIENGEMPMFTKYQKELTEKNNRKEV